MCVWGGGAQSCVCVCALARVSACTCTGVHARAHMLIACAVVFRAPAFGSITRLLPVPCLTQRLIMVWNSSPWDLSRNANTPPNWFSDFDCNEGPVYYEHIFSEWRQYPDEGHMIPADSSVDRPWHCNRCFWPVWEPFEAPDYCCWWCNRQLATIRQQELVRQQELDESAQATDNVDEHAEINDGVCVFGPSKDVLWRQRADGRFIFVGSPDLKRAGAVEYIPMWRGTEAILLSRGYRLDWLDSREIVAA